MSWLFGRNKNQVLLPDDHAILVDNLSTTQLRTVASYAGEVSAGSQERLALFQTVKSTVYSEADNGWLVQNVSVNSLPQEPRSRTDTSLSPLRPVV